MRKAPCLTADQSLQAKSFTPTHNGAGMVIILCPLLQIKEDFYMKELTSYNRVAGYLNKIFDQLNERYFESALSRPTITIQSTPKAYGHFSLRKDTWLSNKRRNPRDQHWGRDALSPHRRSDGHAASISFEKGLHIDVVADSLFDVAFYQLANLMYDDELELRVCPMCNAFFVPKHRNQKYCDSGECYPQKAYKRKKAAEKQRNSQNSKA